MKENLELPIGIYWETLEKSGIPYYIYLGDELVIVRCLVRKRKRQIFYQLEDGRVKHTSFFKKVDIEAFIRDFKINKILN